MTTLSQGLMSFAHVAHMYDTPILITRARVYILIKTMKCACFFLKICKNMSFNILKIRRKKKVRKKLFIYRTKSVIG